jgi:type II secretory pathway component PulK
MPARPPRPSLYPRPLDRGSVILFVLGVILLTAFLLTRLIDRAGVELLAETKAASRTALRDQAYSALEVTLAVLADISANDGGLHAPQQGWDNPLDYAGYEPPAGFDIAVTYEDETGKLPLASASEAVLQHYLETIGATSSEAEQLTDTLQAWMKADYLPRTSEADPQTYENAPQPYAPPHRPVHTFEELRAVAVVRDLFFDADGHWTELGTRFRADVSLQTFTSENVNTARPNVLVALGVDPTHALALSEELTSTPDPTHAPTFYHTVSEAAAVHGAEITQAGLGADVKCLRVIVTVRQGARVFALEAVIQPGSASAPAGTPATPAADASTSPASTADPGRTPTTPVDSRAVTSKSIDYPFRILELRETDGPAH